MTIPNLITAIRIVLAPVFLIYLINSQLKAALVVFLVCAVSDGLDGIIARVFNQKSKLGAYMDPLADKLVLVVAFVALSIIGIIPPWLAVTVIARDMMILVGILVLFLNRLDVIIKPSFLGKTTTWAQFVTVLIVLSKSYLTNVTALYPYIFYLTGLLTISSGLHYMHRGFKIIGEGPSERQED
jgi:cardiolipin synthase